MHAPTAKREREREPVQDLVLTIGLLSFARNDIKSIQSSSILWKKRRRKRTKTKKI